MITEETYTLTNGVEIPKLALGTWMIPDDEVAAAVRAAIDLGYRHIDTAQAYQNERGVGEGVRTSGVGRDELFITTKLAAEAKTYDEAAAAIEDSLVALGVEVIDLMLIHSPQPWRHFGGDDRFAEGNRAAWRVLEDAYRAGKLGAIGVSNFQRVDVENLLEGCRTAPMVNQVLAHISNLPTVLIEFSQAQGMLVEAYSPIAHGELMKNDQVTAMAERYGVSVPQLAIRFTLELGLLPLPKTTKPAHMKNNAAVDFEIRPEDLDVLKNLPPIEGYGEHSEIPVFAVNG